MSARFPPLLVAAALVTTVQAGTALLTPRAPGTGWLTPYAYGAEHHFTPSIDRSLLAKPIELKAGLGSVHQKVPTSSVEAQAFYDQGLAQLHAYDWIDAARSFRQALRFDPKLVLPHLGLVRAYEGMKDQSAAKAELAQARLLGADASPRERLYVTAFERKRDALYAPAAKKTTTLTAYKKTLDALIAADENDAEAWLLRGNAEEGAWGRGQSGKSSSLRFYEAALRAVPNHFGAHHYLAHSHENMGHAEQALHHARLFARSCPKVPHARHMYAHTLPRVGRWDEAIAELEAARALEEERAQEGELPTDQNWHHVHNLNLLGLAYLRTGRDTQAESTLRRAFETPIPNPLAQSWHAVWPEFLLVDGRPAEAAQAARTLAGRDSPVAQAIGIALEGEAHLDAGNDSAAAERSGAAHQRIAQLEAEAQSHPRRDTLVWVAKDYVQILDARRALHGQPDTQWLDYVERVGSQIGANPTFDGWGVSWLRLRRLERDARQNGHRELADRLAKHLRKTGDGKDA